MDREAGSGPKARLDHAGGVEAARAGRCGPGSGTGLGGARRRPSLCGARRPTTTTTTTTAATTTTATATATTATTATTTTTTTTTPCWPHSRSYPTLAHSLTTPPPRYTIRVHFARGGRRAAAGAGGRVGAVARGGERGVGAEGVEGRLLAFTPLSRLKPHLQRRARRTVFPRRGRSRRAVGACCAPAAGASRCQHGLPVHHSGRAAARRGGRAVGPSAQPGRTRTPAGAAAARPAPAA